MQQIEKFEALTLKYAIKNMIKPTDKIRTDMHHSYQHLSKEMNIKTPDRNTGKG